jgi:hypothetical protein
MSANNASDPPTTGELAGIRALRSREAGYSVARKCLELQGDARGHLTEEAESWYLGTLGEIEVGRLLTKLGPEWLVLHSVPFGTAETDIDHVVIGPRGIFTLNTKHHRGGSVWVVDSHMRVDNFANSYLKASLGEGKRVAERLWKKTGHSIKVTPVLVMVGASSINDKRERTKRRPAVVGAHQLLDWLRTHPITVTESEADLAKLVAEEPDTWHVDPHAVETLRVMQRFERLRAEVEKGGPRAAPRGVTRPTLPARSVSRRSRETARKPSAIEKLVWGAARLVGTLIAMFVGYQILMGYLASMTHH